MGWNSFWRIIILSYDLSLSKVYWGSSINYVVSKWTIFYQLPFFFALLQKWFHPIMQIAEEAGQWVESEKTKLFFLIHAQLTVSCQAEKRSDSSITMIWTYRTATKYNFKFEFHNRHSEGSAWRLPEEFLTTAWELSDDSISSAWRVPSSDWRLPDDCLTTTWQLPYDCLITAWWLHNH